MIKPADTAAPASDPRGLLAPGPLLLVGMIALAALSRLLPHPQNFSPVEAIGLFGGAFFARRSLALAVPLLAMFASDLLLGVIGGGIYWSYVVSLSFWSVYAAIALCTLLGFALRGRAGGARILGASPFTRGFSEISFLPGANASVALHMDWGAFDEFVKALEIGLMVDVFAKKAPILVSEENNQIFFNFFINLQLGKRR